MVRRCFVVGIFGLYPHFLLSVYYFYRRSFCLRQKNNRNMYEKILILKKKKDRKTLDQAKINNILFWIADMHLD